MSSTPKPKASGAKPVSKASSEDVHQKQPVDEDFVNVPSDKEGENTGASKSQPGRGGIDLVNSRGKTDDGSGDKNKDGDENEDRKGQKDHQREKSEVNKKGDGPDTGKSKDSKAISGPPKVLHVLEYSEDGNKARVSFDYEIFSAKGTELGAVRSKLAKQITDSQAFCYSNGSEVADSMRLDTYLATIPDGKSNDDDNDANDDDNADVAGSKQKKISLSDKIYILSSRKLVGGEILLHPPFVINVAKWQASPDATISQGSLHSNTFGNAKVSLLTLAGLRKRISNMSRLPSVHKFCTPGGVNVEDENLTLTDYLSIEGVQTADSDIKAAVPSVMVYFKLNLPSNQPNVTPPNHPEINLALSDALMSGAKKASDFTQKTRADIIDAPPAISGTDPSKAAGYLTEDQWNEVLRNCGIMYGWVVDRATNSIIRAPKAAFRLRAKGVAALNPLVSIPDFAKPVTSSAPNTAPAPLVPPPEIELQSIKEAKVNTADPVFGTGNGANIAPVIAAAIASNTTITSSATINPSGTTSQTTPTVPAAIATADPTGTGPSTVTSSTDQTAVAPPATDGSVDPNAATSSAPPTNNTAAASTTSTDTTVVSGKITTVMPTFQVNDNSRIDITACEHEFETSMARNDFSSQSTEASMSGGFAGFSVSVSAGYASSKSTTSKTTDNTYQKTMIAKYLFPRADLYLDPDELEPTPELYQLLLVIAKNKNIKDLRKLQAEFGHLFCQSVTVGGRLLSTKVMQSSEHGTEEEQKSQFKVSVGVSVQTPIGVGASMNHSEEKGTDTSTNTTSKTTNESNVFEAVGGDTILASNPAAWATTVGDYRTWRVINRDGLVPLAAIISGIPGYQQVQNYFVQAVPALSKFIELDDGRQVKSRLRLTGPMHGLSFCDAQNPAYYLSHAPSQTVNPKLMYLEGTTFATAWGNNNDPQPNSPKMPLFHPSSFHAPVIQGFENNMVGSQPYGVAYDQSFVNSIWTITSPFNEALQHGGRVILQTVPFSPPIASASSTTTTSNMPTPPTDPVALVIYRNQQGVFLPGMSSISDFQYWRILKVGGTTPCENIKEGDEITLAWAFSDQTAGFRDYSEDTFGRRRNQCPPELEHEVLYMKLPWPRFESLKNGLREPNSMVMSTSASARPTPALLNCLDEKGGHNEVTNMYLLEEVKFRIDTVANSGLGDTDDYLLKGVVEQESKSLPAGVGMLFGIQRQLELNMLVRMFFL